MTKKIDITLTKKKFGEDLVDEQIDYWQSLGLKEIWRATREVTLLGYAMQGLPINSDNIDKNILIKQAVPWSKQSTNQNGDA